MLYIFINATFFINIDFFVNIKYTILQNITQEWRNL